MLCKTVMWRCLGLITNLPHKNCTSHHITKKLKGKNMEKYLSLSPLALAFIGDAVHTQFVREFVLLNRDNLKLSNYHTLAKSFCNAKHQKEVLEKILPTLCDAEKEVVRRARNAKSKHKAKNFDEEEYKKATAFEALVGYLYLSKQSERLNEILNISVR